MIRQRRRRRRPGLNPPLDRFKQKPAAQRRLFALLDEGQRVHLVGGPGEWMIVRAQAKGPDA